MNARRLADGKLTVHRDETVYGMAVPETAALISGISMFLAQVTPMNIICILYHSQ
jgi:hypothetical protein